MPRNYAQIFAICKKHGFDYKDKVAEFTNGRTDSLKALTDGEYHQFLIQMVKLNEPVRKVFTPKPGDPQRKKMIAIAKQMRWNVISDAEMMARINHYCITKTAYKKSLMDLTIDELNKVLFIFEHEVLKSFLKSI